MNIYLLSLLVGAAVATIGVAQASEPIGLSERQLDQVTAGSTIVFTTGDGLASFAALQQSGLLTTSVPADVQAFFNQLQPGQVTGANIIFNEGGYIFTTTSASTPALQQSGLLTTSVPADVQAFFNQLQPGQVTGANIIFNEGGYIFTTTSASTPALQQSGLLTTSVPADVQAFLNQLQPGQVTGANIIFNGGGYIFTTTSASAFLGIGGVPVPITIFAF